MRRGESPGGPYTLIATNLTTPGYLDTNVTDGKTYYYVVAASSSAGTSADSIEVTATPQLPKLAIARQSGSAISLAWPAWATNFHVYSATNLSASTRWTLLSNLSSGASIDMGSLTTNSSRMFFRLGSP